MKTIGLIGGMSWESTVEYYRIVNQTTRALRGGLHSAQCILYSFDFAAIENLQHQGDWEATEQLLIEAAQIVEQAGAQTVLICTNTMHKHAGAVQQQISIPLLHIADATAAAIHTADLQRVALLGTRFTMEEDFYKGRLIDRHGIDVLTPNTEGRDTVHRVIYEELCRGEVLAASRQAYQRVIGEMVGRGAQGVILGCTEIGLLISAQDTTVPVFDTTRIHAEAAVKWALD